MSSAVISISVSFGVLCHFVSFRSSFVTFFAFSSSHAKLPKQMGPTLEGVIPEKKNFQNVKMKLIHKGNDLVRD